MWEGEREAGRRRPLSYAQVEATTVAYMVRGSVDVRDVDHGLRPRRPGVVKARFGAGSWRATGVLRSVRRTSCHEGIRSMINVDSQLRLDSRLNAGACRTWGRDRDESRCGCARWVGRVSAVMCEPWAAVCGSCRRGHAGRGEGVALHSCRVPVGLFLCAHVDSRRAPCCIPAIRQMNNEPDTCV